jgi:tRNA (guanine-N7-)-methyltransferase
MSGDAATRLGVPFPGVLVAREHWTRTRVGLGPRGARFDWAGVFGREAPRVLDLGCGNGRFLIASAIARPDWDHLGVELVPQAVRFASLRAGQRGLRNVKFAWGDATEFLLERCAPRSVDEVHLYHPQPYFDAGKRGRRQLAPAPLLAIHRALRPNGLFVFQTDNAAYARYARAIVPALFEWRELEGPWPDAPRGRTLREVVARARGLAIVRAEARRRDLSDDEAARRAGTLPEPRFDADRPRFTGRRRRGSRGRGRGWTGAGEGTEVPRPRPLRRSPRPR